MTSDPVILAVAPNGARLQKSAHPGVPIAPAELAAEASACVQAGATLFHLHVRGDDGSHILDAGRYQSAIDAVAAACPGLVIQVTTEAVGRYQPAEQMALIRALRPEAFSISIGELIRDQSAEAEAREFLEWASAAQIHAQHILYSPHDLSRYTDLLRRGIIPDRDLLPLLVCGRHDGETDSLQAYQHLRAHAFQPDWMVCGFGPAETELASHAMRDGGHCRIGFENNLLNRDGARAASNAERVREVAQEARKHGRNIADQAFTRKKLGLPT